MSDDKILLATGDKALLDAAAGKGEVTVLTPTVLGDIQKNLAARIQDIDERYDGLVKDCAYETRLAVTAWVFKAIVDHASEGGTFRYLIYNRLGFGPDAYVPLYTAAGMTISNEFDLTEKG
jgi:hypothetical protein